VHLGKQLCGWAPPATSTCPAGKVGFQRDGVVVLCIVGAVHKRHGAASVRRNNRFHGCGLCIQFLKVPSLKLCPFGRLMAKPLPQFSAGRDILQPGIKTQVRLLHTAGPQPFDQESDTIVLAHRIVSTLKLDHRSSPFEGNSRELLILGDYFTR